MDLVPKYNALSFSADDEASLEKAVIDALSSAIELNMGLRRCTAFPATNTEVFLFELASKETKTFISKIADKVRGRLSIDHAVIHLMYIPVILKTTHAQAEIKLKNLATGEECYGGTKVNLNEAFVLSMTWPRSFFMDEVNNHKGLYLGGSVSCDPSVPRGAKIGMWYPMWTERASGKQLYQQQTDVEKTQMLETYTRKMISSDKEMRSLMRSRATIEVASRQPEPLVMCSKSIGLLDKHTTGVDFTVKNFSESTQPRVICQLPSTDVKNMSVLVPVDARDERVVVENVSSEDEGNHGAFICG
nr:movement protein [Mercurialis latent virus]